MKIPNKVEIFEDVEYRGSYFVHGAKGENSALMYLEIDEPKIKGIFVPRDGKEVTMHKCLDCGSYWMSEDRTCGDCGEQRLSKRDYHAYYFTKRD